MWEKLRDDFLVPLVRERREKPSNGFSQMAQRAALIEGYEDSPRHEAEKV
jgi:hypothetical protein